MVLWAGFIQALTILFIVVLGHVIPVLYICTHTGELISGLVGCRDVLLQYQAKEQILQLSQWQNWNCACHLNLLPTYAAPSPGGLGSLPTYYSRQSFILHLFWSNRLANRKREGVLLGLTSHLSAVISVLGIYMEAFIISCRIVGYSYGPCLGMSSIFVPWRACLEVPLWLNLDLP